MTVEGFDFEFTMASKFRIWSSALKNAMIAVKMINIVFGQIIKIGFKLDQSRAGPQCWYGKHPARRVLKKLPRISAAGWRYRSHSGQKFGR